MAAPRSLQETAFLPQTNTSQQLPTTEPPQNGYGTAHSRPGHNAPVPSSASSRMMSLDLLRGLLMGFMAMDHNTFAVRSWPHGLGRDSEDAGHVITRWNYNIGIFVRMLSHLCAPGFTFLLGVGVVLLAQSRRKRGWTAPRLAKHYAIRGVVLLLVTVVWGMAITMGEIWLLNSVMAALAVDYTLAGMIWLGIEWAEGVLVRQLDKVLPDSDEPEDEENAPLLHRRVPSGDNGPAWPPSANILARHAGTAALFAIFLATLWLNIWMDPTNGHCLPEAVHDSGYNLPPSEPEDFWRFWFYSLLRKRVMSPFPPLAWLSPAIFGLVYGRLVFVRPRPLSATTISIINVSLGVVFAVLFVLTRLLHFGNLTEDCLRIIGQPPLQPGQNQYLQSFPAFFYSSKYPPDPAYIFYSFSGNFFLLALFGVIPAAFALKWLKPLLSFGQSALFFYVFHLPVVFVFGSIFIAFGGHKVDFGNPFDPDFGMDQWWAYWGNWLISMAVMWPLCNWYGAFKHSKGPDSIWRFF